MRSDFVYKTGKLAKVVDDRTLQLARYLTPAVPTPPASIDWGTAVKQWGMLGNDTAGDCAWAGQAHADMLWAANGQSVQLPITTQDVLKAYEAVTGYNPNATLPNGNNPTDRGTTLLAALKFWHKTGFDSQKINAFVEIDPHNVEHVQLAIDLFGCAYLGVQLPDSVLPTSSSTIPAWTVTPDGSQPNQPDPNNGHCVVYCAYDATGPTVVTWGTTVKASWGFHQAYCDELYAMLSPAFFKNKVDPQGIDMTTLQKDLQYVQH